MFRRISIPKTALWFCLLTLLPLVSQPLYAKDPLRNSSRECAICHFRWVDAFERDDNPNEAMQDVLERKAGSGDMCLSCHDGSVVDSRFKVWSTQHHNTETIPSDAVKIPTDKFPLDDQGRMTCATCHTAHAVDDDSDLKTVVFLRQPNVDSSLCLACHSEHAQKNDFQHPLGRRKTPVPQVILDAGGKTSEDGHEIFCQTCHAPHGAGNKWMLVLPTSKLCIACHTERAPDTSPEDGSPMHRIGQTYPGFEPPKSLLDERATFGAEGQLDCLSCHRLHDASGAKPLLIKKNDSGSLCLECHKKETTVIKSPHDLRISSPKTVNAIGQTPAESGTCGVCHRIHGWARKISEKNIKHSSGCIECHKSGGPGSLKKEPKHTNHPLVTARNKQKPLNDESIKDTLPKNINSEFGCTGCHDPHAGSGSAGLLRLPIEKLCIDCHSGHAQKNKFQHPLGRRETPIPQVILDAGGKTSEDGHEIVCQTCHTPHGEANKWMLILPTSKLCIACHTKKAPDASPADGSPMHRIGQTYPGFEPPKELLDKKATFGAEGQLDCLSCHRLHDASGAKPLLIQKNDSGSLCLQCHKKETTVIKSPHDLRFSSPKTVNAIGETPAESGTCGVCHRIHGWARKLSETNIKHSSGCIECHKSGGPGSLKKEPKQTNHPLVTPNTKQNQLNDKPVSNTLPMNSNSEFGCAGCHDPHAGSGSPGLLRLPIEKLCIDCHQDKQGILNSKHDPSVNEWAKKLGYVSQGSCIDCHPIHNPVNESGIWKLIPTQGDAQQFCQSCHDTKLLGKQVKTPHLGKTVTIQPQIPLDKPVISSDRKIMCATCHDIHNNKQTPALLKSDRKDSKLCLACHTDSAGIIDSLHDLRKSAPDSNNVRGETPNESGPCGSCHLTHQSSIGLKQTISKTDFGNSLCTSCHNTDEKAVAKLVPKRIKHPRLVIQNRTEPNHPDYMPTFNNQGDHSSIGTVSCMTCHDPHFTKSSPAVAEMLPPSMGKFLRPTRHKRLCADCHGIESLWRYLYYHHDRNTRF